MYFIQPIEILFSIKPVESASSPILKPFSLNLCTKSNPRSCIIISGLWKLCTRTVPLRGTQGVLQSKMLITYTYGVPYILRSVMWDVDKVYVVGPWSRPFEIDLMGNQSSGLWVPETCGCAKLQEVVWWLSNFTFGVGSTFMGPTTVHFEINLPRCN